VLLFPLLYAWPRFQERLDRQLYPQRARLPELVRELGGEMAAGGGVDEVLDTLADAARRLCDSTGGVAFVLAGRGGHERVRTGSGPPPAPGGPLADEPLVQLLSNTRREIRREQILVEPFYANVREECARGFQRLGAVLLLPIEHRRTVIGGLAVGPRASGDVYEKAEIEALSTVVQQAAQAIVRIEATERLRARESEFSDLKRFFPPQIIEQVMARGGAAELRSQRKMVTVVFADLRGFTSFSESVEPEEVMATLAEYHAAMGRRIAEYAGTLEGFAGDGLMVFFNDPVDQPDHPERAAGMARAMQSDMDELRERWARKGYRIHLGIGIDSGYATCGFVGYEGRREYAVIGNVSNLAARLSDAAGPGEILISARVYAALANGHGVERVGELTLKGFHQAQPAYRLVDGRARGREA
jgi:class 3 adenylate cyclase